MKNITNTMNYYKPKIDRNKIFYFISIYFSILIVSVFFISSCTRHYPTFNYQLPTEYLEASRSSAYADSLVLFVDQTNVLEASNRKDLSILLDNDNNEDYYQLPVVNEKQKYVDKKIVESTSIKVIPKQIQDIYKSKNQEKFLKQNSSKDKLPKSVRKENFFGALKTSFFLSLLSLLSLTIAKLAGTEFTWSLVFLGWGGAFILFFLIAYWFITGLSKKLL